MRDAAQVKLLEPVPGSSACSLRWSIEVPLPMAGDQRAWDARGRRGDRHGWRFGVEAETAPRDVQALARRLALKARDGAVDGVILVLPSHANDTDIPAARPVPPARRLPGTGAEALRALAAGIAPTGNAIVVL